ncbi:hypothetical protein G5S35_04505 [Paraburkholderia tropica]|uniref:hypothetical protein n=1 Tax=Paraburkholderia tropica TaxID=92647 RepID=UPI00160134D3|nr:hypothetical protein [Paraburkholderia tropica]QNB10905.1 hypothetical protein G5S35_04505 [Paraburkholderia tropica]
MSKQQENIAVNAPNELELLDEIDQASGLLASAAQSFADLAALLEAVVAAAPAGSLQSRIARAGQNLCDNLESDFTNYSLEFSRGSEQHSRALGLDEFRRFSVAKQSSSKSGGVCATVKQ